MLRGQLSFPREGHLILLHSVSSAQSLLCHRTPCQQLYTQREGACKRSLTHHLGDHQLLLLKKKKKGILHSPGDLQHLCGQVCEGQGKQGESTDTLKSQPKCREVSQTLLPECHTLPPVQKKLTLLQAEVASIVMGQCMCFLTSYQEV